MKFLGMAPPKISLANSNLAPRGRGSILIQQSPNWPWPPVCFLWRPCTSAWPRIVSRYGILGGIQELNGHQPPTFTAALAPSVQVKDKTSGDVLTTVTVSPTSCALTTPPLRVYHCGSAPPFHSSFTTTLNSGW